MRNFHFSFRNFSPNLLPGPHGFARDTDAAEATGSTTEAAEATGSTIGVSERGIDFVHSILQSKFPGRSRDAAVVLYSCFEPYILGMLETGRTASTAMRFLAIFQASSDALLQECSDDYLDRVCPDGRMQRGSRAVDPSPAEEATSTPTEAPWKLVRQERGQLLILKISSLKL